MKTKNQGTPRTLDEAIRLALIHARGPEIETKFKAIIRDYLSQKFNAAMLAHPEFEEILLDLFKECVGEK